MEKSAYFYIKTAFTKIGNAFASSKGCKLTADECFAISIHTAIPDAIGDYDQWEFDESGQLIEGDETDVTDMRK